MSGSPATGIYGGNTLIQKMPEATRCTIINLDIRLNGMVAQADLTRSLTVRMKLSISGTCSFLDAQFRFMPRAVISLRSGSNSQSVCMCVILKARCGYNLCTSVIPYTMCSTFRSLIIITMANMMCRDMVLRKPISLIYMRSQQMVTSLYLSSMVLVTLFILMGSTCCILRCTFWTFRFDMLGL